MEKRNANWTEEELILAYNLYCKTPFGKIHIRNPEIIDLAKIIKRTPSALSWKLANFARLDPNLQKRNISGASHGGKGEIEIWDKFHSNWEDLIFQSEMLMAKYKGLSIEDYSDIPIQELPKVGKERDRLIKIRVNQNFFRRAILSTYNSTCAITGINISELLVASHIIPWSQSIKERLNPRNGICLNALHDKAFDRGIISFSDDFELLISSKVKKDPANDLILNFKGSTLHLPKKFQPDILFLKYHRENVFIG
ncbi:MAG TPA: HNH endonuclease [Leptospiraceae bacterium]|nr:HNH endonuclease [Leptospiraceae bacterium]